MHIRIVDLYRTSTHTALGCFESAHLNHPEDLALQDILRDINGHTTLEKSNASMQGLVQSLLQIKDPSLQVLFAFAVTNSRQFAGRPVHADLLRGFLLHVRLDNLPYEFAALLRLMVNDRKDPFYAQKIQEDYFLNGPRTHPRYANWTFSLAQSLAIDGRLQWLEERWPSIEPDLLRHDSAFVRQGIALCRFINAVECGRLQELYPAFPEAAEFNSNPIFGLWLDIYRQRNQAYIDPATPLENPSHLTPVMRHHINLSSSMQLLLTGHPEKAASRLAPMGNGIYENSLRIATVLALGDTAKAARIASQFHPPIDDYLRRILRARALYLSGQGEEADREYSQALHTATRMGGLGGALRWARLCGLEGEGHALRCLGKSRLLPLRKEETGSLWDTDSLMGLPDSWVSLLFEIGAPETYLDLVGESPGFQQVKRQVEAFTKVGDGILIEGESGTGKNHVARVIHERSGGGPFLAVSCAGFSEELMSSELFGHTRGSFTGAVTARRGLFEEAGKGTLLLDDVQDMPSRLQAALLQVLETREIRPLGSSKPRSIHCRILAATSEPLESLVTRGTFRSDLQHRLEKFVVKLPPLRERRGDIPLLVRHCLARIGSSSLGVPESQMHLWETAPWKGNIRELRNAVEQWAAFATTAPTAPPPEVAPFPESIEASLASARERLYSGKPSMAVRRGLLLALLKEQGALAPKDLSRALKVNVHTILSDLAALAARSHVRKRERSHLYEACRPG